MKTDTLEKIALQLLNQNSMKAVEILNNEYPFTFLDRSKRTYTETQKIKQYIKDGFIDRYSGERLVNPGLLKVISFYLPNDFPYHPHWKMDKCHNAYWELIPTLPGLLSLSFPGKDGEAILHRMDLMGISISTGSACDSVNTEISHVLQAIRLNEDYAKGTIRISLGKYNTEEEVNIIAASLIKILG